MCPTCLQETPVSRIKYCDISVMITSSNPHWFYTFMNNQHHCTNVDSIPYKLCAIQIATFLSGIMIYFINTSQDILIIYVVRDYLDILFTTFSVNISS